MTSDDWKEFIAGCGSEFREIGCLAPCHVRFLKAQTTTLRIGRSYAEKVSRKPNFKLSDFALVAMTLESGIAHEDEPRHITFIYEEPRGAHWKLTIKTNEKLNQLFIVTFHRIRIADVRRMQKRRLPLVALINE